MPASGTSGNGSAGADEQQAFEHDGKAVRAAQLERSIADHRAAARGPHREREHDDSDRGGVIEHAVGEIRGDAGDRSGDMGDRRPALRDHDDIDAPGRRGQDETAEEYRDGGAGECAGLIHPRCPAGCRLNRIFTDPTDTGRRAADRVSGF
jgi:hypothetical protein